MEKWILLIVTLVMVFIACRSIKWLSLVKNFSAEEIEKTVGYDYSSLPRSMREQMASQHRNGGMPFKAVVMMVGMALAMVVVTFKAFFG